MPKAGVKGDCFFFPAAVNGEGDLGAGIGGEAPGGRELKDELREADRPGARGWSSPPTTSQRSSSEAGCLLSL